MYCCCKEQEGIFFQSSENKVSHKKLSCGVFKLPKCSCCYLCYKKCSFGSHPTSCLKKMVLLLFWEGEKRDHFQDLQFISGTGFNSTTCQALELIPDTIFCIFSSLFSMLDLKAHILSCWSLISCSSSASSILRGSTALSVALQCIQQNTHNYRIRNTTRMQ